MHIEYRFNYSEDHLLTSLRKFKQRNAWRLSFFGLKTLLAVPLALLLGLALRHLDIVPSAILGGILGILLASEKIDSWFVRRRFRKSPYYNDEIVIEISEDGVRGIGRNSESRLGWAVYTKARRFKDGVLLFQGPRVFNWLPDTALVNASQLPAFLDLIRKHVRDYRAF